MNLNKILLGIIIACLVIAGWFFLSELYTAEAQKGVDKVVFEVKSGESVGDLVTRLQEEQIIRNSWLFKKYLIFKGLDKKVNYGEFEVVAPITLSRVAKALSQPGLSEATITIIPGWTIRDISMYFESQGRFQAEEITEYVGLPAVNYKLAAESAPEIDLDLKILEDKPWFASYEGYLAPETYRIYKNATVADIILRLLQERENQITDKLWEDMEKSGRTFYEVLTMASVLEKEVKELEDKKKVADIFWRRYDLNWALQADSTVHYALGKTGDVFTTQEERNFNSPWNTYKYPGLPFGPICNPSLESIKAAIYPEKNNDWYFLTTSEGEVKYAKNLENHNRNRAQFLNL